LNEFRIVILSGDVCREGPMQLARSTQVLRFAQDDKRLRVKMAEEKTQGAGTLTEDAPGENTVQVTFLPEGKTVQFENGKLPYEDHGKEQSLLDVALNFGIPLDHACGGNCACTTCHIWVKEGAENLSEMDDDEADRLDMAADLQLNSRLGCQAQITKPGKVVVEIPAWNRNYVSEEH
jgi:2Fe-2S ferredoxin